MLCDRALEFALDSRKIQIREVIHCLSGPLISFTMRIIGVLIIEYSKMMIRNQESTLINQKKTYVLSKMVTGTIRVRNVL